jgi:hypothetical protein
MIEQVSHQLFGQFASCVRATLEAEARARRAATPGERAAALAEAERARPREIRAVPLLLKALWAWLLGLFRQRPRPPRTGAP